MKLEEIIEDLVDGVKKELQAEKKDRENNEDTLLSMLEGTCQKIQSISENN